MRTQGEKVADRVVIGCIFIIAVLWVFTSIGSVQIKQQNTSVSASVCETCGSVIER